MAQVAFTKSGLLQKVVGPYLERSDHKPRQPSVSRLRRVTAHRRTSSPISGMSEVHEFKQGSAHTWSEATTVQANSSFDFEVPSSTAANTCNFYVGFSHKLVSF